MANIIDVSQTHAETLALALYELKMMIKAKQGGYDYQLSGLTPDQLISTLKDIQELDKMIKITNH